MSTIKTVAERAGVSLKTVSRVFSAPETVTEKTRARVLAAADALDFVPDQRAQAMRLGRSGVVGLLTDVMATTPCSIDIVRGVEAALEERRVSLVIGNLDNPSSSSTSILRSFRAGRVDGVIYAANYHREIEDFEPLHLPSVMVNCFTRDGAMPAVVPDEERGGHNVGVHLIELGHRRIAYLTLAPGIEATRLRQEGFVRAMREAGMVVPDPVAFAGQRFAGAFDPEEAFAAACRLLGRPDRPTAIFCGNDELAIQVYNAAIGLGLTIPDDLSVVGFDDHRLISTALRPLLTTVALPYVAMGRLAVDVLLDAESDRPDLQRVEARLVIRQSTGIAR
ncbi:transcriptional regulator, LacI family [Kaistia soli DSM 19436]|uniref:Transcriptional regulator, LacI family n=1 Tax=Kaistia soli DSM 19436 TaxID=1122133 RepID=A0A1M4YST3_9HYPH|nr:LacI family DNA-binding transcriptional regulator [Kaistia soli]SHF08835.1 transcriptional regulator, LacI family [Kaistia soli DSM 19436]